MIRVRESKVLITTPVLRAAMADMKELPFDSEPAFCCCEFTDRHGNRAHGLDAGGCDTFCNALCDCQPQACKEVISDRDASIAAANRTVARCTLALRARHRRYYYLF